MRTLLARCLIATLVFIPVSLEAAEWAPLIHMDRMLFPSYVIASAGIRSMVRCSSGRAVTAHSSRARML